jgi:AcrR family transcriptional regulator
MYIYLVNYAGVKQEIRDVPKALSASEIESMRESICDVAELLFARHGPDGVTMRQLADALGVSAMTPYRYFADKDAILAAVRTRAFDAFARALDAARSTAKGSPERAGMAAYLDFALAHPAAYRLMFDTAQPDFAKYPELVAAMERARRMLGAGLADRKREGNFTGDPVIGGYAFWAAVHGVVMLEIAGLLRPPAGARAVLAPMLEALSKHYGFEVG